MGIHEVYIRMYIYVYLSIYLSTNILLLKEILAVETVGRGEQFLSVQLGLSSTFTAAFVPWVPSHP